MRVLISRFSTTRLRDQQGVTPAAVRAFKARTLGLLALACLLVAVPATAQVNYAVSGNTAYVTSSPNASGDIVIASTYNGYPVTSIGFEAFSRCTNLTSVTIPNSVTSIGFAAFRFCNNLTSATIPDSVTNLAGVVFSGCTSLTNLSVDAANPAYRTLNGVLFNKAQTTLITYPGGRAGSYVIPDSVTSIGGGAFQHCTSLTSVTIPTSVNVIGSGAFQYCTGLTSMTIPNRVTSIGGSAFYGCANLTSVTIPNSVTSIGHQAFSGCTSLTNLSVDAANPVYRTLNGVLFNKAQTTLITYPGGRAGSYVIPDSVTSIGGSAFYGCTSMTNVTIGNSVTSIPEAAFYRCTNLTNVIIGNRVTSIGFSAFVGCTSLPRVTIPASVTRIEGQAFAGCTSLTNVTFRGDAPGLIADFEVGGFTQFNGVGAGARAYYYCGTTGWGTTFGGLPTVRVCAPRIASGSTDVKPGGFGFTVTGLTNQTIVVEASTNLVNWQPIWTNSLPGTSAEFVDPEWGNLPTRFYRARAE